MVPMAITSYQYFRRTSHELFFNVHHAFLVVFLATSIHSWASWLLLVPPLLMYMVNRALAQYVIATANARVVRVESVAGHTKLALSCAMQHSPGQFVYLCVPSVSLLEWHPFSMADCPPRALIIAKVPFVRFFSTSSALKTACLFKDMGPGSFTHALGSLSGVADVDGPCLVDGPHGSPPHDGGGEPCLVDGPHGSPPALDALLRDFRSLIFVAGGVGITPIASFLRVSCLAHRARSLCVSSVLSSCYLFSSSLSLWLPWQSSSAISIESRASFEMSIHRIRTDRMCVVVRCRR